MGQLIGADGGTQRVARRAIWQQMAARTKNAQNNHLKKRGGGVGDGKETTTRAAPSDYSPVLITALMSHTRIPRGRNSPSVRDPKGLIGAGSYGDNGDVGMGG